MEFLGDNFFAFELVNNFDGEFGNVKSPISIFHFVIK